MNNFGAFVSGMNFAEIKEKESRDAIKNWQKTGEPSWLEKAEKAAEEAEHFTFLGVTKGLF